MQTLGKYLGEKDSDNLDYLNQLNGFAISVKQVSDAIEWKEEQERKQKEKLDKVEKEQAKKKTDLESYRDKKKALKDREKAINSRGKAEATTEASPKKGGSDNSDNPPKKEEDDKEDTHQDLFGEVMGSFLQGGQSKV